MVKRAWRIGQTVLVAMAVGAMAHAAPLSIERAFSSLGLAGEDARGAQVSPDGRHVAYLRPVDGAPGATAIWLRPMGKGAGRSLVDSRRLGEASGVETDERMKYLERRYAAAALPLSYRWSPSSRQLVVTFDGDLFLVDAASGAVRRLTRTPADEVDAKVAPDDRHISFVRGRDLVVQRLAGGTEWRAGDDAGPTIAYGQAEFVAQEEMRRFTGQWWSPTGARLAYTRVDESAVAIAPRVRIEATAVSIVNDRYPVTGTANARVQLFIRAADGSPAIEADLGPDPDIYLANVDWSRDGGTLYALRQSRDQKRLDLLAIDPATGRSRVLLTERSSTWVDLERDFRPLGDGSFLWGSTRTGWRHLYHYDAEGRLIRPVTSGAWRLANIGIVAAEDYSPVVGVDEARGNVYFIASIDTPIERHLYRISYRNPGRPERLTQLSGWWTPTMAGARPAAFLGQHSDTRRPPNTAIYDLQGRRLAWLAENPLDAAHPYSAFFDHRPTYEFGSFKAADGSDLHYAIAKPPGFDPARRYPVIIRPYGGPNVQTVTREWRGPTDQLLTQAGYLVFFLDNRGGINRSQAFEHAVAGNLGGVNMDDHLAGIRHLASLSFVDAKRIGMMGWSFGGYTTVRMLTEPGSGIAAGAAGGVPADFALYDTHYTERFLGTPQAAPEAYQRGALLPRAKDLHGPLLLLHGLTDDNVVVANYTALADELQKRGKLFESVLYPGMAHVPRGEARLVHMWRTYLDFFARRMPPAAN